MASKCYYFYGVSVGEGRSIGYITSAELIRDFGPEWMLPYQRERVSRRTKITALTKIFTDHEPIDAIKLNLIGSVQQDGREAILEGSLHVIDGQQRLWALKESGVTDFRMPVELYLNLSYDQEVRLFHQFNDDGTDLSFGDLCRSFQGPMAEMFRKLVKSKTFPVKLAHNNSKVGMTPSMFLPVMDYAYRRMFKREVVITTRSGKELKRFLQAEYSPREVEVVEFVTRNVVAGFVSRFGTYDCRAMAYRRSWFQAWCHLVIDHFVTDTGQVSFGTRKEKVQGLHSLLQNARVRELMSQPSHVEIYDIMVDHLNHKVKTHRLDYVSDLATTKGFVTRRLQQDALREEQAAVLS